MLRFRERVVAFFYKFPYLIDFLFIAGHRFVQRTVPTHPPFGKTLLAMKEMPVTVNGTKPLEVQFVWILFLLEFSVYTTLFSCRLCE